MIKDISQQNILNNVIAYFACEYHDIRCKWPTQTWIYKYLALLDFRALKLRGTPVTGLSYTAMKLGPVPKELYYYKKKLQTEQFRFEKLNTNTVSVVANEPNLSMLPPYVVELMDGICDEFMTPETNIADLIDATHREITAWQKAWKIASMHNAQRRDISFSDEFEKDPHGIPEKDLTPTENAFLFYEATQKLKAAVL